MLEQWEIPFLSLGGCSYHPDNKWNIGKNTQLRVFEATEMIKKGGQLGGRKWKYELDESNHKWYTPYKDKQEKWRLSVALKAKDGDDIPGNPMVNLPWLFNDTDRKIAFVYKTSTGGYKSVYPRS